MAGSTRSRSGREATMQRARKRRKYRLYTTLYCHLNWCTAKDN